MSDLSQLIVDENFTRKKKTGGGEASCIFFILFNNVWFHAFTLTLASLGEDIQNIYQHQTL